jgi:hypothetical protein
VNEEMGGGSQATAYYYRRENAMTLAKNISAAGG